VDRYALSTIRILDFTWAWAGPYCTKLLVDMGAEVIKIETNKRPDVARWLPPFADDKPGLNRSGRFNKRHRGKLSIAVDMTTEAGCDLVRRIIRISDVIAENYSPRVMKKFGLEYEAVREIKPDIIYVSLSAFGATGLYKDYVAYGPNQAAMSGLANLTGYRDGPPMNLPTAIADPTAGLNGAVAVLAALYYRSKTGKGQHIDLSQTEMFTCLVGQPIMDYVMNGRALSRDGNRHQIMAPHNFYRCRGQDKWVAIAIASDDEWHRFCDALGNPSWASDEKFSDQLSRWRNQEELDKLVEAWTINHTPYEVMEMLQKVGVAAMPAFNGEEIYHNPQLRQRGFLVEVDHPEVGKKVMPGVSMKLSETPGGIRGPAPLLGEHNHYVFGDLLGMSPKEIAQLEEQAVIY